MTEQTATTIDRDFRPWQTTPEEVDRIAAGDRDAMNEFYFRNYKILLAKASKSACVMNGYTHSGIYSAEELMQQLWCDLPLLSWSQSSHLNFSIKQSFAFAPFGGLSVKHSAVSDFQKLISIDSEVSPNDSYTYLDILPDDETPATILEKQERFTRSAEDIAALFAGILSPRSMEWLLYVLRGEKHLPQNIYKTRFFAIATIYRHFDEVIARLRAAGIEVPDKKPADFESVLSRYYEKYKSNYLRRKSSPEKRAADNAKRRERDRAAKAAAEGARA